MSEVNKCINDKYKCYCNNMRECEVCKGNHIKDGKCELTPRDFCTCRNCGRAIRADGYKYNESK